MNDHTLPLPSSSHNGGSPFDAIRHVDQEGDHWIGRELMPMYGYTKWDRFAEAIERARQTIAANGGDIDQHIRKLSRSREGSGSRGPLVGPSCLSVTRIA